MGVLSDIRSQFNRDKGASYANEYEVNFDFSGIGDRLRENLEFVGFTTFSSGSAFQNMMMLCDEASLPGKYAATQEIDGMYAGRLINFPHAKLFNDFSLSWINTNQVNPTKFFEAWMYSMFPEYGLNNAEYVEYEAKGEGQRATRTNITTLTYYDEICCKKISVQKSYKTRTSEKGGKSSITHIYNAYPYAVESIPLGYGPSTLVKLRVQFRYEKNITVFY